MPINWREEDAIPRLIAAMIAATNMSVSPRTLTPPSLTLQNHHPIVPHRLINV